VIASEERFTKKQYDCLKDRETFFSLDEIERVTE